MNVGSRSVVESMVCNIVARNITQPIRVIAHEIYTAHVKPLETALAKAEADKAALVEALEAASVYIGDESCGSSEFWEKYRAALARVKGEA